MAEVIQRGQEILDSIDRFLQSMYGYTVPIDLYSEYWDRLKAREQAESVLVPLGKPAFILDLDLPLDIRAATADKPWALNRLMIVYESRVRRRRTCRISAPPVTSSTA